MLTDLTLLFPELTIVAVVALLVGIEIAFPAFSERFGRRLNFASLAVAAGVLFLTSGRNGTAFDGLFIADSFAVFFKSIFLAAAAFALAMKNTSAGSGRTPEFHLILWSALLGMFFLVSSGHFLLLFISLELMTLSLYVLAAYTRRELVTVEAGLKYLVMGSLASAFLLYGISLVYASTGTLSLEDLKILTESQRESWLFMVGILLILSALGFKVAAVPFHVWVPDVYQGAPTAVVAFLSVASKSAGFAVFLRLLLEVGEALDLERRVLFSLLASLTLLYGNLGALRQTNLKRLLGYSSIGHAGFLLIALAAGVTGGGVSLLYYLIAYAVSNLTAFLVVSRMERIENSNELRAYGGLARRSPFLALAMFLAFLSLAGVPPLAGFFSKFFILLQAARGNLVGLVFLGAVNVAVSLYYYLNVIRTVYLEKPQTEAAIQVTLTDRLLLGGLMIGIILVGLWQAPFVDLTRAAVDSLF